MRVVNVCTTLRLLAVVSSGVLFVSALATPATPNQMDPFNDVQNDVVQGSRNTTLSDSRASIPFLDPLLVNSQPHPFALLGFQVGTVANRVGGARGGRMDVPLRS